MRPRLFLGPDNELRIDALRRRITFGVAAIITLLFAYGSMGSGDWPVYARGLLPKADLMLWHSQGEDAMKALGIQQIFDTWAAANAPGSTLTLVQKAEDDLAYDFPTAMKAKSGVPDLLWV